jgi:hypothetical protein
MNPAEGVGLQAGTSYIYGQKVAADYHVHCLVLGGGEAGASGLAFFVFFAPQTMICSDRTIALIDPDPISVEWLSAALDNNRDTAFKRRSMQE